MIISIEQRYSFILGASLLSVFAILGLLWQKYSGVGLQQVTEACSAVALHLSYTTFSTTGKLWGSVVGLLTGILCVKFFFSVVKTKMKTDDWLSLPQEKLNLNLKRLCREIHLAEKALIFVQHSRPIAVTIGFFQPRIVISTALVERLTARQLQAVLLHEKHHFTNFHPTLFCSGEVISQSLSVLPIIKEIGEYFKFKLEQEADLFAAATQGTDRYVQRALATLHPSTRPAHFPTFTHRPDLSKEKQLCSEKGLIASLAVAGLLLLLTFLPISVQAQVVHNSTQLRDCSGVSREDCTTYCQSSGLSFLDFENRRSVLK